MLELRQRPRCFDCDMPVSSHAEGCETCGVAVLCGDCRDAHERLHQQRKNMSPVAEESGTGAPDTSVRCGAGLASDDYPPMVVDAQQVRDWQRLIARSNAEHPGYPHAGYTQAIRRPDEPVAQGEAA